jgi:hypothetical protein
MAKLGETGQTPERLPGTTAGQSETIAHGPKWRTDAITVHVSPGKRQPGKYSYGNSPSLKWCIISR